MILLQRVLTPAFLPKLLSPFVSFFKRHEDKSGENEKEAGAVSFLLIYFLSFVVTPTEEIKQDSILGQNLFQI